MDGLRGYVPYGPPPPPPKKPVNRLLILVGAVGASFAVALAVIIGQRLNDQAMAVLAGSVCGVAASIPTSLLIVWVTRRRQEPRPAQPPPGFYPPVVVVQPPPQTGAPGAQPPGYLSPYLPPAQREFTVVGGGTGEDGQW